MAEEIRRNGDDSDDILPYHYANVEARCILRDRFGINLDDFGFDAAEEAQALVQKYSDKEAADKQRIEDLHKK